MTYIIVLVLIFVILFLVLQDYKNTKVYSPPAITSMSQENFVEMYIDMYEEKHGNSIQYRGDPR